MTASVVRRAILRTGRPGGITAHHPLDNPRKDPPMARKQWYLVELHGDVREVYSIEADSEEDALERWHQGNLELSEASGMEVYSVKVDD